MTETVASRERGDDPTTTLSAAQLPVKAFTRSQQMDFHPPFDGGSPESNRPSLGLPRLTGFDDFDPSQPK
jgi:hypothetical protein